MTDSRHVTRLFMIVSIVPALRGAVAQAPAPAPAPSWRMAARVEGVFRYDDNPFLLSAGRKQQLDQVSPADSVSGRFRDMTSATDGVPMVGGQLRATGPGLGGRDLELSAEAGYDVNIDNARRRHAELLLGVEQSLPKAGRLRLRADWRPSYFAKNYLSDASDVSGDGNISPDERVYRAGTSHEIDLTLNYRRRLVKAVRGELELGYFARGYDAPFAGRDRRGPGASAGVAVELNPRWSVGLDYDFQALHADPTREVLILDELDFGVDFNGTNGVADTAARAFELVDRSRTEQELRASVETELSDGVNLQLAYALRSRNFSSTQPYDVSDRDRHDTRHELEAELTVRVAHGMRLVLGGVAAKQNTNRAGDPGSTGEVSDYSRRVVTAGLEYRF